MSKRDFWLARAALGRDIAPETGYYVAGLVDGEGCFFISGQGWPSFILKLRADDRPLLDTICAELGVGRVRTAHEGRPNCQPAAQWVVSRKRELLWLTEWFDFYPLRSKKAADYAVWREAVIALCAGASPRNDLGEYRDRLRAAREFAA